MDREVSFTFKTLTGQSYPMTLPLSTTVTQLVAIVKEQIYKDGCFRLICGGNRCEDNQTLADIDVETNKIIHIVLALRKPVVLLYDQPGNKGEFECNLTFKKEQLQLLCSYPKPNIEGSKMNWVGNYISDQTGKCILTINNRNYSSLFWEADLSSHLYSTKKWVVLNKENPADDFFYYLNKCGLNNTEANDCVVYWMKTMKQCKRVCVRMVDVEVINDIAKLNVPGFEKIHRVIVAIKNISDDEIEKMKCDIASLEDVEITERPTGKYVIEWGCYYMN
ncbi:Uncharacterized protein QTN25_000260 [Entamoeba marina]